MNDLQVTDATTDAHRPTLAELKRQARKVRSRHPLARGRKGGRGSRKPAAVESTIDSLASKNSAQKGLVEFPAATFTVADGVAVDTPACQVSVVPVPFTIPAAPDLTQIHGSFPVKDASPAPLSDEEKWAKAGDINVLVYARPVNPRMLLITLDDGSHGRCLMHPADRQRFSVGKRIWVRHERKDVYRLTGRYNRWGGRCA